MTRTIKASEVKPGMEVQFATRMKVRMNILRIGPQQEMRDDSGHVARVDADALVTVLSEPAPVQPEEPAEFGARVRVRDGRFVRLGDGDLRYHVWHEEGTGYQWTWDQLCAKGPVTVVPDQGWAVPDTLEVPERIDEWPEDDTALRDHKWRGHYGNIWTWFGPGSKWVGSSFAGSHIGLHSRPTDAPFTRVIDA